MSEPSPPATSPEDGEPTKLGRVVTLLDDVIRIPGTNIRIGLDPILGFFFPGVGDWITGTGGAALLLQGLRAGVPTIVLVKMLFNILIDAVIGTVPVVGDVFDVFFRAHRRNHDLIQRHGAGQRDASALDHVLVGIGILVLVISALAPLWIIPLLWTLGGSFLRS